MQSNEELLETGTDLLDNLDDLDDLFVKPVKKKKILFISDHPLASSGVGIQARLLIQGLLSTGKYTFRCLGGAMKHGDYNIIKVTDDWLIKPVDGFGTKELLRELLVSEKPDAIVIFTDPRQFIWLWEMEDEIHQVCPIAYWHIWDNDPYPKFNQAWYESTDLINCISHKTYELVKPNFPEKTNYIPHAFPKEMYAAIPAEQVQQFSKQNFGDRANWFKVLWVNRNATRKMPNDILASWKEFLEALEKKHGHKNAMLIMHTDPNDMEGPNLLATAEHFNLQDHVWFSTDKIDFNHMNLLHNLCDTTINISKNEGHGLTLTAMLQTGKPIIALCTGGMTRQVVDYRDGSENGVALKSTVRSLVGSQLVPYIYEDFASNKDIVDAYMKIYEMTPEEKEIMREKTLSYVEHEFNINKMITDWDSTLEKCVVEFKEKLKNDEGDWSITPLTLAVNEKDK